MDVIVFGFKDTQTVGLTRLRHEHLVLGRLGEDFTVGVGGRLREDSPC